MNKKDNMEKVYYETPILETDRLILKRGTLEDYQKVYEFNFSKLRNIKGEFEFVKNDPKLIEEFVKPFPESYDWIVYLKDGNIPISNIVCDRERKDVNAIEVSFNTYPDYWRGGYTTEALIEILVFLFDSGYENVLCGYDEGNFKSELFCKKLGFEPFEVCKNTWFKNGEGITTYTTIMSYERFNSLYKRHQK